MVLARPRERSTTKIDSKNSLYPLSHFTEQLMGVFSKIPQKNNLDHESSSFFDPAAKDKTGF
jgi:hypothetical protein